MAQSLLNLSDDYVNKSMVNGLCDAFKAELKDELMAKAETEVDSIVEKLSKRLEVNLDERANNLEWERTIKLEWLLRKESE